MHAIPSRAARRLALVAFALVAFVAVARSGFAFGWSLIDAKIRQEFPQVKRIATADRAAWLGDPARTAPVLLDVRARAEFDVSHLADAQQVEPTAAAAAIRLPNDQPIVTYCSVGYRSGAFAQRLQAAGYQNVQNLEGSTFRWANEGRPVFRNHERVDKVHPYNHTWGLLLRKRYRAAVAAPVKS